MLLHRRMRLSAIVSLVLVLVLSEFVSELLCVSRGVKRAVGGKALWKRFGVRFCFCFVFCFWFCWFAVVSFMQRCAVMVMQWRCAKLTTVVALHWFRSGAASLSFGWLFCHRADSILV